MRGVLRPARCTAARPDEPVRPHVRRLLDAVGGDPGKDLDPGLRFHRLLHVTMEASTRGHGFGWGEWLVAAGATRGPLTELILQTRLSAYAKRRRSTVEGG